MSDIWRTLKSVVVDMKAAVHCGSLIDIMIDRDDFLVESLLHLSNIHSACRSVHLSVRLSICLSVMVILFNSRELLYLLCW